MHLSCLPLASQGPTPFPVDLKEDERLVFVYGSLLSGDHELFHNHEPFLGCEVDGSSDGDHGASEQPPGANEPPPAKVCDAVTEESTFVMVARSSGNYPFVLARSDLAGGGVSSLTSTRIRGEVWRVGASALEKLDRLEGHPSFYRRRPVPVLVEDEPDDHPDLGPTSPLERPGCSTPFFPDSPTTASRGGGALAARPPWGGSGRASAPTARRSSKAVAPANVFRLEALMYLLARPRELEAIGAELAAAQAGAEEVRPLGDWRAKRVAEAAEGKAVVKEGKGD